MQQRPSEEDTEEVNHDVGNAFQYKTEEMAANILKKAKELSKPMMEAQKEYARAHQSVLDTPLAKQTAELLPEGLFPGAGIIGGESTSDFMQGFMASHNAAMSSMDSPEASSNNSLVQDMENNANIMQTLGLSGTNSSSQIPNELNQNVQINDLLKDVKNMIDTSKNIIVKTANSSMLLLYWNLGKRIKQEILKYKRAEYGMFIMKELSKVLTLEYGRGFAYSNLTRMAQFFECYDDYQIVATLSQQLTWSHIVELLPINEDNKRNYYSYIAVSKGWSVRSLRSNIRKMTYERSSIAKQLPDQAKNSICNIQGNKILSLDLVLKDPYLLDFLNLPDEHYENELENAILSKIEEFILELGARFSFVSRQKKMIIDNEKFYLDLLFFNRKLNRLVAVELKTDHFKAAYKGQMELYLAWLKKYECYENEESPIGIILCSEKSQAQVELLEPSKSGIHVAEYWSSLPPIEIFEKKLQKIILETREKHKQMQVKKELELKE